MIKVCLNPICEDLYHNCPNKPCYCKNCNGKLLKIDQKTYIKKYIKWFWQFDYNTEKFFRPQKGLQLELWEK